MEQECKKKPTDEIENNSVTTKKEVSNIFSKVAVGTFLVIGTAALLIYLYTVNKAQDNSMFRAVPNKSTKKVVAPEPGMNTLRKNNDLYRQGVEASLEGDKKGALTLLEKSKESETATNTRSIIDFTIATVNFDISRSSGIKDLMILSSNESYSPRIRALSMLRAYLLFLRYNDVDLLKSIASYNGIMWTNSDAVTVAYMKKIYGLYPFAYPIIKTTGYQLDLAVTKEDAESVYSKNKAIIQAGLEEMKANPGERTELTSSMLANSQLMGRLYLDYGIGQKSDVDSSYKNLIEYDRLYMIKTNEQYALLSYANFLSGVKDYEDAEQTLETLLSLKMDKALIESLPKANVVVKYPYFKILSGKVKNIKVKSFIDGMGSSWK